MPVLTALVAFVAGGLVVLATGSNPFTTYRDIFEGTGLNWPYLWLTGQDVETASANLQQTLIVTTALILTGLAVAFAFRGGLFNIGGQGQYIAGVLGALWVGTTLSGLPTGLHIALSIAVAALAGAALAGLAGLLKAAFGAHEVITTIMLNWIVYWVATFLIGPDGPLRDPEQPASKEVVEGAKLPVIWGEADFQGLHAGFLLALAAVFAFWLILSRTTLGYEVRAVGFNPEAARYAGISVPRNLFAAMAIAGVFAGLAGALDVLGWQHSLTVDSIQASQIGFLGIAVALLGRNTALGTLIAAVLFGALLTGTSTRSLGESSFPPELAGNLTLIIQGLVVLFIGADLLVLYLWRARVRFWRWRSA